LSTIIQMVNMIIKRVSVISIANTLVTSAIYTPTELRDLANGSVTMSPSVTEIMHVTLASMKKVYTTVVTLIAKDLLNGSGATMNSTLDAVDGVVAVTVTMTLVVYTMNLKVRHTFYFIFYKIICCK